MYVDAGDLGLSSHLMLDGYWEMWLTEALAAAIRPGMTVVDVGANLGYFSLLMADRVGPRGRVHAFEPNPPIVTRLRRNVAINGFDGLIAVHDCALSSEEGGHALLVAPEGEPKNAHLIASAAWIERPGVHRVRTRRLDAFPELFHADVIKIDADTAEEAIWRGMSGLLDAGRSLTVFLEFAAARYLDPPGFLRDILNHGFSLARLELDAGVRPATPAEILAAPSAVDQILVLKR
jgi:FkbM family methyltransferase